MEKHIYLYLVNTDIVVFYVPGSAEKFRHEFNLEAILGDMVLCYFHLRDEKTEAQRSWEAKHGQWQSRHATQAVQLQNTCLPSFPRAAVKSYRRLVTETVQCVLSQLGASGGWKSKIRVSSGPRFLWASGETPFHASPQASGGGCWFLVFLGLHLLPAASAYTVTWLLPSVAFSFLCLTSSCKDARIIKLWAHPIPLQFS